MENKKCQFCGKEFGTFQAYRNGKVKTVRKWRCDNFECQIRDPYNHTRSYFRLKNLAHKIANKYPDKVKILKECECQGKRKIKHHPDYSKPLEVELLCYTCHWKAHEKMAPGFNSKDKYGTYSLLNNNPKADIGAGR